MTGTDQLDPVTHARIFREEVLTRRDVVLATPQDAPRAIILGGQPGAGKGGLAAGALSELERNAVVVDPDELRRFHPNVEEFRTQNPYTWSGRTHVDASQWADELRENLVASKRNLIFDITMSNGQWTTELIKDLQSKGYQVEVRAVATPKLESELGVDQRFSSHVDAAGFGRHVPSGAREAIYDRLPHSLNTIHAETDVPIRIFNRQGVELYNNRTDVRLPGVALEEARVARLSDPLVTRQLNDGWRAQSDWHRDLPERLATNPRMTPEAADRLLAERRVNGIELDVQRGVNAAAHQDYMVRTVPQLRAGTALGVAGIALTLYDTVDTSQQLKRHLDTGNTTAAQSELIHFGGRTVGGLAGAGLGFGLGAAAGVETGPGLLVTGAVGGVVGTVAGDKLAAWTDNRSIYNQVDRQGNAWTFDPDQQDLGWRRKAPIDSSDDAIDNARRQPLRASPALEIELNFQATARSVELVLGSPPVPRDPFEQPARPGDPGSASSGPWRRDDGGTWQRTTGTLPDGTPSRSTVAATAERAVELDRAAAQTVLANSANMPPAIAARFEEAYARSGWKAYGEMPEAVRHARTNTDALVASDGDRYQRQPDGNWVSKGVLYDSTASANLREELDATRTLLRERLPPRQDIPTPPPMSEQDRLRDTIAGAYSNASVSLDARQLDARVQAVGATWAEHGLDPTRTALQVQQVGGRAGLDSPIASLRLEDDGRTYRIAATTSAAEIERAQRGPTTGAHAIDPLTSKQSEERREAIEGANRQGMTRDEAQQVGRQTTHAQSASTFAPARAITPDMSDPSHPGHASYTRALDDVRRMEVRAGIPHGDHSQRLAATVAVAVVRDNLNVQRLDMGRDGQVMAIERGPYPGFDERRVPIDTRQALSQSMESSSAQWLSARSAHYASDLPASVRSDAQTHALATLSSSDRAMFARIRQDVPAHVSDDVVAHAMVSAKASGIPDAGGIDRTLFAGDRLFVVGTTPGQRAATDVTSAVPALGESVQQAQQLDQQREVRSAQVAQRQEPPVRSAAMG